MTNLLIIFIFLTVAVSSTITRSDRLARREWAHRVAAILGSALELTVPFQTILNTRVFTLPVIRWLSVVLLISKRSTIFH